MKHFSFFSKYLLPVSVLFVVSCAQGQEEALDLQKIAEKAKKYDILVRLFSPKNGVYQGRPVKIDSAKICIRQLPKSMRRHGILEDPNVFTIRFRNSLQITTSENFGGDKLLEWMNKVVDQYDRVGQGKNLSVDIRLGIYDQDFVRTYVDDPDEAAKRPGRIGLFLVIRKLSTKKKIPAERPVKQEAKTKKRKQEEEEDDDDVAAFDLGSLEP